VGLLDNRPRPIEPPMSHDTDCPPTRQVEITNFFSGLHFPSGDEVRGAGFAVFRPTSESAFNSNDV